MTTAAQEMRPYGVIVGRFQTPYLHVGHRYLINRALEHSNHVAIFVGVSPTPLTRQNPLDFRTRQAMILEDFGSAVAAGRLSIYPLMDNRSDAKWVKNLDAKIREIFAFPNTSNIWLHHSRDSFTECYKTHKGAFHAALHDIGASQNEALLSVNSTDIRKEVSRNARNTDDFRAGVIYAAYHHYPRVQPTVDIAVYTKVLRDKDAIVADDEVFDYEILLGTKDLESFTLCFPGGFVDMNDASAEVAARRKLLEETGYDSEALAYKMEYIASAKIDDWRNTSNTSILTTFYALEVHSSERTEFKAADDLKAVVWVPIQGVLDGAYELVPEHKRLFGILQKFLDNKRKNP